MSDNKSDLEFEQMMKEKMEDNFGAAQDSLPAANDAKLKEMNKRLPAWNLEPPFTYIK